ncbi:T1SS-143 repeat domain-containing protein [Stutzerimonas stutzeri]
MNTLAIVVSLVGQAWAQAANGDRRELRVGDRLRGDEVLITAPGAQVDLDFGDNQLLSFIGEQNALVDDAIALTTMQVPAPAPLNIRQQAERPLDSNARDDEPRAEGHNFVQLVRIGEIIEADGITPLTVARIQELLRPMGMSLPDRVFEPEEWREHRGGSLRHEDDPEPRTPGVSIELQGAGPDGIYNEAEIGPDGTVAALIILDDKVRVGDTLVVTDRNGNELLNRPVTQDDLDNGIIVQVPVSPGDTDVPVTATITEPSGNSGSATDNRPVNATPPSGMVPDRSDVDADIIDLDLSPLVSDNSGGPLKYEATGLPDGLTIDPDTGKITGSIDRSASQNGPNDDGRYPVTLTVTDPSGNSTEITFIWTVTNPGPAARDDDATTPESTPVSGNVLTGAGSTVPGASADSDPDGDPLTVTTFVVAGDPTQHTAGSTATIPGIGTLIINGDGSYTFTPVPGWNGTVPTVTYGISDGEGGSDSANLVIEVTPVDDPVIVDVPVVHPVNPQAGNVEDHVVFESGLVDGSNPNTPDTQVISSFTISALDGLDSTVALTIGYKDASGTGQTLTLNKAQVEALGTTPQIITTEYGELVLDGYSKGADGLVRIDYSYTLKNAPDVSATDISDVFDISANDSDDDSDSNILNIKIVDDVPVAVDDVNSIWEDSTPNPISGNVLGGSGASAGDMADSQGADGAAISGVQAGRVAEGTHVADGGLATVITGKYGTLTLDANGSYTYELDNSNPIVNALRTDESLNDEVFSYTLTDNDGDKSTATLTITIHGHTDGIPVVTVTDYNGLEAGVNSIAEDAATPVTGEFQISAPDGLKHIIVGGQTVTASELAALDTTPRVIPGSEGTLRLTGYDPATGTVNYSYQQTGTSKDHGGGDVTDRFPITVTDNADQTSAPVDLIVLITDTVPVAHPDTGSITEDAAGPLRGNVVTDAGSGEDELGADATFVVGVAAGIETSELAGGVAGAGVSGQYGLLVLNSDGSYSYTLDNSNPAVNALKDGDHLIETFSYTIRDSDGDWSTTTLTITIDGVTDGSPSIVPQDTNGAAISGHVTVMESGLANGSDSMADSEIASGTISINAADGLQSISVGGQVFTVAELQALAANPSAPINVTGGTLVLTGFTATASVGEVPTAGNLSYTYTLTEQRTHGSPGNDTLTLDIPLSVTDAGNITSNGTLTVQVEDDVPQVSTDAAQLGHLVVDETDFVDGSVSAIDTDFVQDVFAIHYGADGAATSNALIYALNVASPGVASGVVDTATGQGVYLYKEGSDIVGLVGSGGVANASGTEAFRIAIDSETGAVTLTQKRPLQHPNVNDHDDSLTLASDAITLTATATDGDGDVVSSTAVEVGGRFTFKDDGPRISAQPASATVDEANLANGSDPDVPQTTVSASLNVQFGSDGAGDAQFTPATAAALEALGLESNGQTLSYVVSADGHTLTAYRGGESVGNEVFTVVITNPATNPGYEFRLHKPLDHVDGSNAPVDEFDLVFGQVRITDRDGDQVHTSFTVTVLDDTPDATQPRRVEVDEDDEITFNTNADAVGPVGGVGGNTTIGDGSSGTVAPSHGTATVNPDGTITYVPHGNYSGTDTFTYTTVTDNETKTFTIEVTVNPVADAPDMDGTGPSTGGDVTLADVSTLEDTAVALGLKAPIITDATDQNVAAVGDAAERLGAITLELTGAQVNGVKLTAAADGSSGAVDITYSGPVTIWLTDAPHPADMTPPVGAVQMTSAQFEALQLLPVVHRGDNIDVSVKATSHEVDDAGNIAVVNGTPVPGATSEATFKVWVQAVTDDAELLFDTGVVSGTDIDSVTYTDNTQATVTLKEDTTFRLNDILQAQFADLDGSEVRSITITNTTGQAILVDGTQLAAGGARTINARSGANGQTGDLDSFPDIRIGAVGDFSGDLNGIVIAINAQDKDADGFQGTAGNASNPPDGVAEADTSNNSVTLNLRVDPVAGDAEIQDVIGSEDTAIAFLSGIAVTDSSTGSGGEIITAVSFRVPAGWTVSADGASWTHDTLGTWTVNVPADTADWSLSVDAGTGTYTVSADTAGFDLKPILDTFTTTPPAHSSRDLTLQDVTVTTVDSNMVDGAPVTSAPATTSPVTLRIEVTPVAEQEDKDSAGPFGNDVTHNSSHLYTTEGAEDTWFVLGQEGAFNLKTGWSNEDGDEETYALLTPRLIFGDDLAEAKGSQFRFSTNGDMTENGGAWETRTFDGTTPVEIPAQYLDTLQFKAAKNFSGKFEIDVRVKTVDYDDDSEGSGTPSVYTSDVVATLENILILPVADQVTLAVHGLAKGDEDTRIPLTIEPRSDDESETYTVIIEDIPTGARLFYGNDPDTAIELAVSGGAATIANFDSNILLTVLPPLDSNSDFTLTVTAKSVDTMPNPDDPSNPYINESPIETKTIQVQVKGVADGFDLQTDSGNTYAESAVDGVMNNLVPLRELITGQVARDTDVSETLNLKITLPDGFSLEGGTWLGDGWLLNESQLATASIRVPEHFSGEVIVGVAIISTEIDGHSISEPTSVTFTITPEVEKTMQDSSALLEDTRGQVQFAIPGGGDTKETLTSVWVDVDDVASGSADYTLYYGSSGTMTLAEAANDPGITDVVLDAGWYKLSGSAIGNVYAQGAANSTGTYDFGVEYTIVNTATNGTATDSSTVADSHTLTIDPVTDPATLVITGITSSSVGHTVITGGTDVEVTGNTVLTIDFQLSKKPDAKAGGAQDHDGSERLTSVVIDGVPQGVTIVGASYIGNVPGGAGSENTGRWLLPISQAIDQAEDGTTFSIEFELLAAADILAGLNDTLTVTAITQDGSAEEVSASTSWTLTTPVDASDFEDEDVSATEPVEITGWTVDNMAAPGVEDTGFQLGNVVQGTLDGSGSFAITITGFSGGSIDGMSETMVNGVPTWTLYGSGDSVALQALLDAITITPPDDRNDNGSTPWTFDVTLTTYAPNGERNVETQAVTPPLAPATDPAAVTVMTSDVTEGDAVTFTVKVEPGVDGAFSQVVDGKLYLRLNEAGGLASGTLTGPDGELALQPVTGVDGLPDGDYYVIENVGFGDEVILTYQGDEHAAGQVSLSAAFLTREQGAETNDIRSGSGSATAVVAPENSGIDFTDEQGDSITALTATGIEDQRVELKVSAGLNDQDGSEAMLAAFLRNVPSDFLVFIGNDAGSATLANNAGDGTWSIPLTGGALPDYIAVQPPRNWSGTESDLELVIQATDQGLAVEDSTLPVTLVVESVADGISISPTLTFGAEGDIIPINLNAAMPDNDGSELATLTFKGLGLYAAFYAGTTLLDANSGVTISYAEGTDTYTVIGLTPAQVNTLGFVQAADSVASTVQVSAYTVDGGADTSATSSGSFDVTIQAKEATGGADVLLYGGMPIDGLAGNDTIQLRYGESLSGSQLAAHLSNIEVIDLSVAGANSITDLSVEDVFGMTDQGNTLHILGDSEDSVTLGEGWTQQGSSWVGNHSGTEVKLEVQGIAAGLSPSGADSIFALSVEEMTGEDEDSALSILHDNEDLVPLGEDLIQDEDFGISDHNGTEVELPVQDSVSDDPSTSSDNDILVLSAEDVFEMPDQGDILNILGDNEDSAALDMDWAQQGNSWVSGHNGTEVKLEAQGIVID